MSNLCVTSGTDGRHVEHGRLVESFRQIGSVPFTSWDRPIPAGPLAALLLFDIKKQ
jgi:hypothetical protein